MQLRRLHRLVPGQRMSRRTSQDHFFLAPGERSQFTRLSRKGHQTEVRGSLEDLFIDPVGVQILDLDPGIGLARRQHFDVFAHVAQADGINGGHLDLDVQLVLGVANRRLQLLILFDETFAALVIGSAQRRELERADGAIDQLRAEPPFQLQDNLTGRRLGNIVGLRGLGEAPEPGHITKHFQGFELHGAYPIIGFSNIKREIYYGFL